MIRLIVICLFSIPFTCYSQVPLPTDFTVAIMPQTPIDMSQLTEAEQDNPLSVLSDTAQVNVKVMFSLQSTLNLESVQVKVLSTETSTEILDITLPLSGDMPENYFRKQTDGFFIYDLIPLDYNGGITVQLRIEDNSGNYSTYLTYPEN